MVVAGRVAVGAPDVIRSWALDKQLADAVPATFEQYDRWMGSPEKPAPTDEIVPVNQFYLKGIREDGYRLYGYNRDSHP